MEDPKQTIFRRRIQNGQYIRGGDTQPSLIETRQISILSVGLDKDKEK